MVFHGRFSTMWGATAMVNSFGMPLGHQLRWEQARSASLVSDSAKRQEGRLRSQQQKALQALLKRIQRDRGEQLPDRHRGWVGALQGWGWG